MQDNNPCKVELERVWGPLDIDKDALAGASAFLEDIVRESTLAVLGAHGVPSTPVEAVGDLSVASVIGFSGDGVAGALGLATTHETLAGAYCEAVGETGPPGARHDWLRELANQVMGRIKGAMLSRGIRVHIALPQTLLGMRLEPDASRFSHVAWVCVRTGSGPVLAWVELDSVAGLQPGRNPPVEARPAGDILLF